MVKPKSPLFKRRRRGKVDNGRYERKTVNTTCIAERIMRENHDLDLIMPFPTVLVKYKISQRGIFLRATT